jgi:hypothetical protein
MLLLKEKWLQGSLFRFSAFLEREFCDKINITSNPVTNIQHRGYAQYKHSDGHVTDPTNPLVAELEKTTQLISKPVSE